MMTDMTDRTSDTRPPGHLAAPQTDSTSGQSDTQTDTQTDTHPTGEADSR
jgi:hypothetical protein